MRILNRPLALVLACALLAASIILIIEVAAAAMNRGPALVHWDAWYAWTGRTQFKAGVIRFWAIVLIAAGIGLLLMQLKPRPAARIAIASDHSSTDAGITRRGLRTALAAAATGTDGISSAAVDVSRRKAQLTCRTASRDRDAARALTGPVLAAAQATLDSLQPLRPVKLAVRITPGSS